VGYSAHRVKASDGWPFLRFAKLLFVKLWEDRKLRDTSDYLEAIEMSLDPEVLREIDEGRGQIERGDFEVMEQLY